MATIVRIGLDGKITLGRMLPHEELKLYGTYKPTGPSQFLQKRRETFRQLQEEQRLAQQQPKGDE